MVYCGSGFCKFFMIEPLLLSTTRVTTFDGERMLTGATGFFFQRDERLFLCTSRHVMVDETEGHHPDRLEVVVHTNALVMSDVVVLSVPLFRAGRSLWRQGRDPGGDIDVAAIEINRKALPAKAQLRAFTPSHLQQALNEVEVGDALLVVGFPLGFYDTVNQLPVVRQAAIASSFGLRFQGQGAFLTDARTHRGTSGAPVVKRSTACGAALPWKLLGVHSARMDMRSRDLQVDESLGLNLAWYADILMTLTASDTPALRVV